MKGSLRFTYFVLFALFALCSAQKSVDAVAKAGGCSTSAVAGLSTQLINQMNCMVPGVMKSFAGRSNIKYGNSVFPYLQGPAVDKLVSAVNAAKKTITINSALRTLPQQYLLYRWNQLGLCGITAAAAPGKSNHNMGLAIDIKDYSSWINPLKAYSFAWFGSGDVVHFNYKGAGTVDLNTLSVKAFQTLWNRNNPKDLIAVDGSYGPQTEARVQRSPSTGFARGPTCAKTTRVETTTCTANGEPGTCIDESDCTGTVTPGLCPSPASNKCCTNSNIEPATKCTSSAGAGTCMEVSSCTGTVFTGLCPGPNNIKCCVANAPPSSTSLVTNAAGVALIKSFEGFVANFYLDPVGIKTIGYGHACHVSDCTNLQAKNTAGKFYRVTPPLSRKAAEDILRADLDNLGFEDCVNKYVTRNSINANEFSALVSFTYNVGCGALAKSTLLKRVNEDASISVIRAAFAQWNKAGGKVLAGLTRRRTAEANLYAGIVPKSKRDMDEQMESTEDGIGAECWHYGQKGVCLNTAFCTGYSVSGLCPGPSTTKCCLRNKCSSMESNDGTCVLATSCTGQVNPNATCEGSTDLQCCVGAVTEPTTLCPDGSTWSTTNRWCQSTDNAFALGPFTRSMLDKCFSSGGDTLCHTQHAFTLGGNSIYLLKWPMDFATRIRGTDDCLLGSAPNNNYQGYCMESVQVASRDENNTVTSIVTEVNVYGAMNNVLQESCQAFGGGLACVTPRWSGDFFRSIAQPFHMALQITNDTVVVDDDEADETDTMSNFWVDSQMKLSEEHESAEIVSETTTTTTGNQESVATRVALSLAALCALFFLIL